MKTMWNQMGRIRLSPLLFQNGCSQSSRFLPQARRIVGSGDENASLVKSHQSTHNSVKYEVLFWLGVNKLHHHKSCIFENFHSRLFVVLILVCEWPLWSGCDMTYFRYITARTIICSVHEHDFESPWLWYVNCGNSYIPLAIFWLH